MSYYLKVALSTLLLTIILAELLGPSFGMRAYIRPVIEGWLAPSTPSSGSPDSAPPESTIMALEAVEDPVTEAEALEMCSMQIKSLSLFPDLTRIPEIRPEVSEPVFRFAWLDTAPVTTMGTSGSEMKVKSICDIRRTDGRILRLTYSDQILFDNSEGTVTITGDWDIRRQVSDIDNSTNVKLSHESSQAIVVNGDEITPNLTLLCSEDKTSAYISLGAAIEARTVRVDARLGQEVLQETWNVSNGGNVIYPQNGQFIALIRHLLRTDLFELTITAGDTLSLSMAFDLHGLEAAVNPLQMACHWR